MEARGDSGLGATALREDGGAKAGSSKIRVMVRVRPLLPRELMQPECVETEATKVIVSNGKTALESSFDRVFERDSTQEEVYTELHENIEGVMKGYNTTIFAYGQTGTGKTYTMFGGKFSAEGGDEPDPAETENGDDDGPKRSRAGATSGIVPRSVAEIFAAAKRAAGSGVITTVTCSFLQIYNERIQDLLAPYKAAYTTRDPRDMLRAKASLDIREDPERGAYVQDLTVLKVASVSQVLSLIRKGNRHRAVRSTDMNERSSRSHTILQLVVEQRTPPSGGEDPSAAGVLRRAKLNLVDLAGSERWNAASDMAGAQITELTAINSSLLALGSVVLALSGRGAAPAHVRYRDSKLTHLLQDALGGNCKTAIIVTVSPAADAYEETCAALKFADRSRAMTTSAVAHSVADDGFASAALIKEVTRLRRLLAVYAQGGAGGGGVGSAEGGAAGPAATAVTAELGRRVQALEAETASLRTQLAASNAALTSERARVTALLDERIAAAQQQAKMAPSSPAATAAASRYLGLSTDDNSTGWVPSSSSGYGGDGRAVGGAHGLCDRHTTAADDSTTKRRVQAWGPVATDNRHAATEGGTASWGRSSVVSAGAWADHGGTTSATAAAIAADKLAAYLRAGGGAAMGQGPPLAPHPPHGGPPGGTWGRSTLSAAAASDFAVGDGGPYAPVYSAGAGTRGGGWGATHPAAPPSHPHIGAIADHIAQQASPARWGRSSIFSLSSLEAGSPPAASRGPGGGGGGGERYGSPTRPPPPNYAAGYPGLSSSYLDSASVGGRRALQALVEPRRPPPPLPMGRAPADLGTWIHILGPGASTAKAAHLARHADAGFLSPHARNARTPPAHLLY